MKKNTLLLPICILLLISACSSSNNQSVSTTEPTSTTEPASTSKVRKDLVIHDENVETEGDTFDYSLTIRPDLTLTIDIDLSNTYEDIEGKYNLHYDIDEDKNHVMVVSGKFDGIIVDSPLIDKVQPEMIKRLVGIAETLGFLLPDQNGSYEWIEEICNDPQNWIQTNISEDSYSYTLDLKTDEGFTFVNALSLLIYEEQHGYSIDFHYSLPTNS